MALFTIALIKNTKLLTCFHLHSRWENVGCAEPFFSCKLKAFRCDLSWVLLFMAHSVQYAVICSVLRPVARVIAAYCTLMMLCFWSHKKCDIAFREILFFEYEIKQWPCPVWHKLQLDWRCELRVTKGGGSAGLWWGRGPCVPPVTGGACVLMFLCAVWSADASEWWWRA